MYKLVVNFISLITTESRYEYFLGTKFPVSLKLHINLSPE